LTTIDEVVRVSDPEGWELRLGEADVQCWGFLPNGRLRHPMWVSPEHCVDCAALAVL
jgi:hypothetical protein